MVIHSVGDSPLLQQVSLERSDRVEAADTASDRSEQTRNADALREVQTNSGSGDLVSGLPEATKGSLVNVAK